MLWGFDTKTPYLVLVHGQTPDQNVLSQADLSVGKQQNNNNRLTK